MSSDGCINFTKQLALAERLVLVVALALDCDENVTLVGGPGVQP